MACHSSRLITTLLHVFTFIPVTCAMFVVRLHAERLSLGGMDSSNAKSGTVKWDAIVLTCPHDQCTDTLQQELQIRQSKNYIPDDVMLLVAEDPRSEVGSGGATMNALLTVVEHLSARQGCTVVNPDLLETSNILILHTGPSFFYDSCSRCFVTLPFQRNNPKFGGIVDALDLMYSLVTEKIAFPDRPGVWVCSTDMVISLPDDCDFRTSSEDCDVFAISIPSSPQWLTHHGVYCLDEHGYVTDILFRPDVSTLELLAGEDGKAPGAVNIVYLSPQVADTILAFHTSPPLDACTYMGVDSGQYPFKLSLFFDVLLPMAKAVKEEDFVRGNRGGSYGRPPDDLNLADREVMEQARMMLWRALFGYRFRACVIKKGVYHYLGETAAEHRNMFHYCQVSEGLGMEKTNRAHAYMAPSCTLHETSMVINSCLTGNLNVGPGCVISNCNLGGQFTIGKDSLLMGLDIDMRKKKKDLDFPDDIVVQGFRLNFRALGITKTITTVHGNKDNIQNATWKSQTTFCNQSWLQVMKRTGICKEDLWDIGIPESKQTIFTARIFPVFHLEKSVGLKEVLWIAGSVKDDNDRSILKKWRECWRISMGQILSYVDTQKEFSWKREVFYKVLNHDMIQTLRSSGHRGYYSYFNTASVEGYSDYILKALDKVASEAVSPGVAARTLACIADVLGTLARGKGGLRSGPARNVAWAKAFAYLEGKDFPNGVAAMAKVREEWMERPILLTRAARHYEGAAQILIRQAVMTAQEFFNIGEGKMPAMNKWVQAECPARIDLAGAWSDTPPITYEHGGATTTVGLLINGKKPIGARARRIKEPVVKLTIVNAHSANSEIIIQNLNDVRSYCQPHSPGALFKAALICIDAVDLQSPWTLSQQLSHNFRGGFEIQSWSNLPHGSGLGTSSILSGCILAALLTAAGKSYDTMGLIHVVLYLEQLLTTGGGWQDQVGGLLGGMQLGYSDAELPLKVESQALPMSKDLVQEFNERLILIYTGKTRLARNLLQDVLRNWYARNPHIVSTEDSIVAVAKESATALSNGDFEALGKCVDRSWELKKCMAPGSEPASITHLIRLLRPFVFGIHCTGAGGGGFACGFLKERKGQAAIKKLLAEQPDLHAEVYDACVDDKGLVVTIED